MAHRFHNKLKIKMKIKRFVLISNVIFIISYYILLEFIFISCSVLLLFCLIFLDMLFNFDLFIIFYCLLFLSFFTSLLFLFYAV